MIMARLFFLLAAVLWGQTIAVAGDCRETVPCTVTDGIYFIAKPEGRPAKAAYVYFHGYKGSGKGQIQVKALVDAALAHDVAFVAVDGIDGSWGYPGSPEQGRDETKFVNEIMDDLVAHQGIAKGQIIFGGFSAGASMAWYETCLAGDKAIGSITFAGVFWRPLPQATDCKAPPPMIHFHGTKDNVFPLAGRPIGSKWFQGDTFESLAIEKEAGRCLKEPEVPVQLSDVSCTSVPGCTRGPITLCLHGGGHEVQARWLDAGLTELGF